MISREDLLKKTSDYIAIQGYSYTWLAEKLGVSIATVSRWYSGKRAIGYGAYEKLYSLMKDRIDLN